MILDGSVDPNMEWLLGTIGTAFALALAISIVLLPIASVVVAVLSRNLVVLIGAALLSVGGFLVADQMGSSAIPVGFSMEVGGLLFAIAGTISRKQVRQPEHIGSNPPRLVTSEHLGS